MQILRVERCIVGRFLSKTKIVTVPLVPHLCDCDRCSNPLSSLSIYLKSIFGNSAIAQINTIQRFKNIP